MTEQVKLSGLDKSIDDLIRRRIDNTGLTEMINQYIEPEVKNKDKLSVKPEQIMEKFYTTISNETYLTIYHQDKSGPVIYLSDELKFSKMDIRIVETKLGVYFITAVGQGYNTNQGLFGPLPFPDHDDYVSIIFTCFMKDSENIDPRSKGQSYCLFVLTFSKEIEPYYRNREFIRRVFENFTKKFGKVQDVTKKDLQELKLSLIK